MTTLTLSPLGFKPLRNRRASSPTYQANTYYIKKGYASAIGFGDAVITLGSPNQGYIGAYTTGGTAILGVFVGLASPYFDTVLNGPVNKNFWAGTESASSDVAAWVIDDPDMVFLAQLSGGPYTTAARGQNIDVTTSTSGVPNALGLSTASLNYSTLATTSTLPFRIIGPSTMAAGGYDPSVSLLSQPTNGYVEVILNPGAAEYYTGTGI